MSAPSPTSSSTPAKRKSRKPKRTRTKVTCLVCHKQFDKLTAEHLREHGLTLTRYRRAFGSNTLPTAASQAATVPTGLPAETAQRLASSLIEDPAFVRDLAGEVQEAIFSTSLRDSLRLSLVGLLSRRLEAHGKAAAALDGIRAQLAEPWRAAQGGPNGGPTPTKELVAMGQLLHAEVRSGEDVLLRTVKMAIEEYRTTKDEHAIPGGLDPNRFTGSAEVLPMPEGITAQDRETMRNLWGLMDRAVSASRDVVDVQPTQISAAPGSSETADGPPRAETADGLPQASENAPPAAEDNGTADGLPPDGSPTEPNDPQNGSADDEDDPLAGL